MKIIFTKIQLEALAASITRELRPLIDRCINDANEAELVFDLQQSKDPVKERLMKYLKETDKYIVDREEEAETVNVPSPALSEILGVTLDELEEAVRELLLEKKISEPTMEDEDLMISHWRISTR